MVEKFLSGDALCVKVGVVILILGWLIMFLGHMKGD
jgi:uncharacterized membrane protein YGL010W